MRSIRRFCSIPERLTTILANSSSDFVRPKSSQRLVQSLLNEYEKNLENQGAFEDFINYRKIVDKHQSILLNTNRLRPPKGEREVMAKIANRVGFAFPESKKDTTDSELAYIYNKLYLSIDKMNTPPDSDDTESIAES